MKRLQSQLIIALRDMPTEFTSNEFAIRLRELDLSEREIGQLQARFLHSTCLQMGTKRTWSKIKDIEPKIINKRKVIVESKSIKNVGLIRKFLKWIY
jgi:hypothetical protein